MKETDVTDKINYYEFDVELLGINVCLCGHDFNYGDFIISVYKDRPYSCEKCGRKYYFTNGIKVYLIEE